MGIAEAEAVLSVKRRSRIVFRLDNDRVHAQCAARLQYSFDGVLQEQFTESLSACRRCARQAPDAHRRDGIANDSAAALNV